MDFKGLEQYYNKPDLIRSTADQIVRDFDMFGLEIRFSGNAYNAYEELFDQIEPHISQLISSNRSKFLSILYRIDLSDEQIKNAVNQNSYESFSAIVTDLIIKRELQKVVIREHFKRK